MAARKRKIDLNRANVAELETITGIGPALARRIIAEKPFRRLADLKKVSGIGDKFYAQIRHDLRVPRTQPEAKPAIRRGQSKAPTKQPPPPILTPTPKTEPDPEPTHSRVQEQEEPSPASEPREATPQVSIPAAPEVEKLSKTEPDPEPTSSRVEEKEEPAPASKPREATPQVSIPSPPRVEKLERPSPQNVSIAIKPRRISPWIYVIAGALLVTVILVSAVASARGLRQPGEATSAASDVNVVQVNTATMAATHTASPETQPTDSLTESTPPPSTPIPATSTKLPPSLTPDTELTATATLQPSPEPTRAIDPALTEKFTFGSVLWTENFDPPTFNWGRGETDIAAAGYVDGALQAILQTRIQPYWSLGPTYQVSSPE